MSLIKLNIIDSGKLVSGILHAATGDRLIAALSVEPETIAELEAGLMRFENWPYNFSRTADFITKTADHIQLDYESYDAGILIIDLAARVVVSDSIYSQPGAQGDVEYHDGSAATDLPIPYCLNSDWLFLESIKEYRAIREKRCRDRAANPTLDVRPILYGRPLLDFIADHVQETSMRGHPKGDDDDPLSTRVTEIHAQWLATPREDLRLQAPRDVILAKQHFISRDMESRALQWSFQMVGPPCLSKNSHAYRFAGFGTHEWVLYYEMVRNLIWFSFAATRSESNPVLDRETLISCLAEEEARWLSEPNEEFEGHVPFILIDNERKRLPEAMGGRSMVIDEDCPICKQMGDESEAGIGIWFYHLDGYGMDDEFAFSSFQTIEEWEADRLKQEEFHHEFDRNWKEREERIARGEPVEPDPFLDSLTVDEYVPMSFESEIPEA